MKKCRLVVLCLTCVWACSGGDVTPVDDGPGTTQSSDDGNTVGDIGDAKQSDDGSATSEDIDIGDSNDTGSDGTGSDDAADVGADSGAGVDDADTGDSGVDVGDGGDDAGTTTGDVVDPPQPSNNDQQSLDFLNHAGTTHTLLVGDVELKGQTPTAILDFKKGVDAVWGTDDDGVFESIEQLDSLSFVGQGSIAKIRAYARNWQPAIVDPLLTLLNSPDLAASTLTDDAGLSNKSANAIIGYLNGQDGTADTADDPIFNCRKEVIDVPFVGPVSLQSLEKYVGLGSLTLLSSTTSSSLNDLSFNDIGEALIVGTPLGVENHILWFTPFTQDVFTADDDPYQLLDFSENIPEAMYGVAFDGLSSTAALVGEVAGIYLMDTILLEFEFVPVADVDGFVDVAPGASGDDFYAISNTTQMIYRYDTVTQTGSVFSATQGNALLAPKQGDNILVVVGEEGAVHGFDAADAMNEFGLTSGEDLFAIHAVGTGFQVAGDWGSVVSPGVDSEIRLPTRRLSLIRSAAVSNDSSYMLIVGHNALILRYELSTGALGPVSSPVKNVDFASVAFSDDGTALIVGDGGTLIKYTPQSLVEPGIPAAP
ncbi:MAG TPA: hypothetical protein EYN06_04085 [Myxococcales bacterium]|nr:hypothetical protein [Myxococcales bacterium]